MSRIETPVPVIEDAASPFWARLAEFLVLFAGLPLLFFRWPVAGALIPALIVGSLVCLGMLWRDPGFDRARLWNWGAVRPAGGGILARFIPGALLMGCGVALMSPEVLFGLPARRPVLWGAIMVLYPLLSVFPQEIIYRAFFHHRYSAVFPTRWSMIAASAAAFAFGHIIFRNELAVVLTLIGGGLFAWTYEKTRSLLAVAIEHALYGAFIFTIGLGPSFYAGRFG